MYNHYRDKRCVKKCKGLTLIKLIMIQYLPNQWIAIFARFDWHPQLEISLDIHCFANGEKMARHFAKVSEEEIVSINEAAFFYPSDLVNTKTTIPSGSVESGGYISTTIHFPFGG